MAFDIYHINKKNVTGYPFITYTSDDVSESETEEQPIDNDIKEIE